MKGIRHISMMTFLLGTMAKENILKITARDDKEAVKRFLKGHKGKRPKREFDIVLQHDLDFKRNIKEVVLDLPFTEKTTKFVMSPTSGNLPDNYFVGSDEEGQQAQFTFDLRDNDSLKITGTIQLDDETTYLISTCQDGSHWIKIIVPGDVPPEEEVEQHQVNELVDNPHDNIIPVLEKDEERTVVDVLIVYTANAMCTAARQSSPCNHQKYKIPIEDLAYEAINNNNLALENSGIEMKIEVRGFHFDESYDEMSRDSPVEMLYDLRNDGDVVLDSVHETRDKLGADIVVMIVNRDFFCGISFVDSPASYAFSIVDVNCIPGHTIAHEIGHLFGCLHNKQSTDRKHPYAHGYQDKNSKFRSILAYSCKKACPRALMYSTPDYTYERRPIGSKKENCALLIQERKHIVSSFRRSVPIMGPLSKSPSVQPSLRLSSQPSYTKIETTIPSISSSVAVTVNEPSILFNTPSISPSGFCADDFDESYIANKKRNAVRYCRDLTEMKKKRRTNQCDKAKKESKCIDTCNDEKISVCKEKFKFIGIAQPGGR